jgi:sigma-E factor negative regulatory protein RseA
MQEQAGEKISLLIDDELDTGKALSLLKNIQQDQTLQNKLQRYQIISQVLKNETSCVLEPGFADKIHNKIKAEPVIFLPVKKAGFNWQTTGLALAASIALFMVWAYNRLDNPHDPYANQVMANISPLPMNAANVFNDRFNDYLQAHDNRVYNSQVGRVPPYARVVDYQQDK